MTGPEHYRAAERLLSDASYTHGPGGDPVHPAAAAHQLAMAQAHATLALAAASVHGYVPTTHADREGWQAAVSAPDPDVDPLDTIL